MAEGYLPPVNRPLAGGHLHYQPGFISDSSGLFTQLRDSVDWQQPMLKIYGRSLPSPRLVSFVGDLGLSYRYSGQSHHSAPWPRPLLALRERLANDYHCHFNCALLNYYRSGDDTMGWHSDDEAELGPAPVIASVSLGESRDFRMRPKARGLASSEPAFTLTLEDGSLLLMLPPTQRHWQHSLPRRAKRGGRINITFRQLLNSPQ